MSMSGNGQWYESVAVELYMSTGQRSKQSWSCELLNTLSDNALQGAVAGVVDLQSTMLVWLELCGT